MENSVIVEGYMISNIHTLYMLKPKRYYEFRIMYRYTSMHDAKERHPLLLIRAYDSVFQQVADRLFYGQKLKVQGWLSSDMSHGAAHMYVMAEHLEVYEEKLIIKETEK